jgi:hypothetical protein
MVNEISEGVSGSCYCRGVQFSISPDAQVFWSGYCHCEDCRRSHAAPIYQAIYFVKEKFEITSGSDLLKWYTHEESLRDSLQRYFCERCGTRVFNALRCIIDDKEVDTIGTFPSLFNDHYSATGKKWGPRHHSYCGEAVMNLPQLHDDLPRHDGMAPNL